MFAVLWDSVFQKGVLLVCFAVGPCCMSEILCGMTEVCTVGHYIPANMNTCQKLIFISISKQSPGFEPECVTG